MPNFIIEVHRKGTEDTSKAFIILNKRMNSGKWNLAEFNTTKKQ